MPGSTPNRLAAACTLVLSVSLLLAPAALGKGAEVDLRVVGKGGKVLTERTVRTASTQVETSSRAACFGKGSGGSGAKVTIAGDTAMGVLARASLTTGSIAPLLISDHFDFGLALCGVGGSIVSGEASWYLKIDHRALAVGGDQAKVKPGQEVLWDLAPSYPYPDELVLQAPPRVSAGVPFGVRAFSYDEKGRRKPAAGVRIPGAAGLTGSDGRAVVTLNGPRRLGATKDGDIPAARVAVCVGRKCPGAA
ncbi:MAG: hypothetical protein U0R71_09790 [Solirubrobacterales bacterium]